MSKRKNGFLATLFTKSISQTLQQDIDRYNLQYKPIEIKTLANVHDRFLIVDDIVYHIGASLKDLGKKLFAFSKMELGGNELLKKL